MEERRLRLGTWVRTPILTEWNRIGVLFHKVLNSIRQPVANDAPQRLKRVFQSDLLAVFISPARVADWNLVDAPFRPALGDLGGEFGLAAETVRAQRHSLEHLAAKNLVARLHIGEIEVREDVGQHR